MPCALISSTRSSKRWSPKAVARSGYSCISASTNCVTWSLKARLGADPVLAIAGAAIEIVKAIATVRRAAKLAVILTRLLQRAREQLRQFVERAIGLRLVVNRSVGRRPTVERAFVDFAFVFSAPRGKRSIELFDRLLRHAAIFGRVSEVESRLDARQHQMRARRFLAVETAAVERRHRGNFAGHRRSRAHRHRARETVANDADRSRARC